MPVLVQARTDDEIADVIEKIRAAKDPEVGVVLPRGNRALQTPLNARLLSQFSKAHGRRTAIVSDEPRVQELARANGFPVYASVPAFERGIELGAPMPPSLNTYRPAAAVGGAAAAATALREAPPRAPTFTPTGSGQPPSGDPRRTLPGSGTPPPSRWRDRRRPLYFAGGAVAVIGLLLFFALAPSAKITITVAGTPITKNAVIQGSTDANAARQGDHILTAVINATATSSFAASPTGNATLPATNASGHVYFQTNIPSGAQFSLSQGAGFQTADGTVSFLVTQTTYICIGPNGQAATPTDCGGVTPNNTAPVQAQSAGAAGNVPARTITRWNPPSEDPCTGNPFCIGPGGSRMDIFVSNFSATGGGADQKQVTTATPTDVSGWNTQVTQIENTLTSQLNSQIQGKTGGKTIAVDPGGNGKAIAFDISPKIPNPGDQFAAANVTINATANAVVYDPTDVRNDVIADLNAQVTQGDELAPGKLNLQPCMVTQASTDGTVILSCSASDFAQPIVNLAGLKGQLAGKNPGDAQKVIQSSVDKVQGVTVSEFPFRLFYLPFFSSRIEIDENFVAAAPSTP